MLAKITTAAILFAGTICTCAFGQQPLHQPGTSSYLAPAAFTFQGKKTAVADNAALQEQLERLQLRLRELELDVDKKLGSQPDQAKKSAEQDKELDERLEELEESCKDQGKSLEKLEDAVPAFVISGHKKPKMKFFGRLHLDYWAFPDIDDTLFPVEGINPQDRVQFRRLRLGVSGDINDNMFYKFEGEFAGGRDPSYRDAYLGFSNLPRLRTVIIGNQKRPYGLDHLNSSKNNVFMERPFIVEAFNQDSRRLGVSSNGYSEDLGWNWRYGVFNQELTQNKSGYIGDHYQAEFVGRLARTAWYDESSGGRGYAHVALSGGAGTPDGRAGSLNNQARYRTRPESRTTARWLNTGAIAGANANYTVGVESVLNIGPMNIQSEYMRNNVDRRDAVGEDVAFDGYYTQISFMLTGEHHPWNRETGTLARLKPFENFFLVRDCDCETQKGKGAWEVALRYSYADLNDFDIQGGEADSYTIGLNWYWNPYARMQFNYLIGDIKSGPNFVGEGDYQIVGVRVMIDW
jgi:phosphate-selective porin OprO/OprP